MDFNFTAEQESFRAQLRQFLQQDWTFDRENDEGLGSEAGFEKQRQFEQSLAKRGWLTMAWPPEYGGSGADHLTQLIFNEECARAGAYVSQGTHMVGPCIMLHGTEQQKRRFLPAIARGEELWCQGFSEPSSGSDLASLQTRAVRDGDDYVINGQKIWTSGAKYADWIHILTRTDPDGPKHRGISYFLVDMKSPGISVQPIVQLTGQANFNQTFLDNVRVPRENMLGEENRGWYVATTTLDFERSSVAHIVGCERNLRRIVDYLATEGRARIARRPTARDGLADMAISIEAGRLLAYRVAWMQSRGLVPNYEASISKVYGTELSQRLANFAINAIGLHGQLENGSAHAPMNGLARNIYLGTMSATIAAGTSEVQRNIIATRGLGLPR